MANEDIKAYAKQAGVLLWEVAEALHITDVSLSKKLRNELDPESKREFVDSVDRIARQRQSK